MNLRHHRAPRLVALASAAAGLCAAQPAARGDAVAPGARDGEAAPPEMEGVEVVEKLGGDLPLDLTFTDETGAPITLRSLFTDGKPVILTFNYSTCPVLCSVQLGGLVASMNELDWSAGEEFRVITIGLDPAEGHRRAMETKLRYLGRYRRPEADAGWRFLTGSEASIRALAAAVGFGYKLHPTRGEYLHPAVLIMVSPKGIVSSYLYGVEYPPGALKLLLSAARLGELKESTRKFLLACFHYDKPQGAAAVAARIMRVGGVVFLAAILVAFGATRAGRARKRRERTSESA